MQTFESLVEAAQRLHERLARRPTSRELVAEARTSNSVFRRLGTSSQAVLDAALGPAPAVPEERSFARDEDGVREVEAAETYLITCAQNDTPVESGFFQALLRYSYERAAVLAVIPVRYKNPTQRSDPSEEQDGLSWAPELEPYLIENEIRIAPDLVILANVRIQATSPNPLSGLGGRSKGSSAIFGHPKLMMQTIATPQNKDAKVLYTTGSVTQKNYSTTKLGDLAAFHHMHGAILIERQGEKWWMRSLIWDGEAFYDIDERWTAEGFEGTARVSGISLGDEHVRHRDEAVVAATFGPGGLCETTQPYELHRHDTFDGDTINWHDRNNTVIRAVKAQAGLTDLRAELDEWVEYLRETTPLGCTNYIVESNHDERLTRWLQGSDAGIDPQNLLIYYELKAELLRSARVVPGGVEYANPLAAYAERAGLTDTVFLSRDQSHLCEGIECALHGDEGANGARGSARGFAQLGVKTNTEHTHAPWIFEGNWCGGVLAMLRQSYNRRGPSSWAHAVILIHENGRRQMPMLKHGSWWRPR